MATELPRPGVEVVQEFQSASPTIVTPTLVPCVVAPYFEVIEVLKSDGTLNSDAKLLASYDQLDLVVPQSSFPSPRSNIDEVNVGEDSIRAFLNFGGSLVELKRTEAFLVDVNIATKPWVHGSIAEPGPGFAGIDTTTLILCMDGHKKVPLPGEADIPAAGNVTITFGTTPAGGTLFVSDMVAQINAILPDVAYVANTAGGDWETGDGSKYLGLRSNNYGAGASVVVRKDGTANPIIGFSFLKHELAIGAGFYATDDSDQDTTSPRLEVYQGTTQIDLGDPEVPDIAQPDFIAKAIEAADVCIADGVNIGAISEVSSSRLTMEVEQRLMNQDGAFHPNRFWVQAKGLSYPAGSSSETATLTGSLPSADKTAPYIVAGTAYSGTVGAGQSVVIAWANEGEAQDDQNFIFPSSCATLDLVVAAINGASGLCYVAFKCNKFGDEQADGLFLGLRLKSTYVGGGAAITLTNGTSGFLTASGFALGASDVGENYRYLAGAKAFVIGDVTRPTRKDWATSGARASGETIKTITTVKGVAQAEETVTWAASHAATGPGLVAAIADWNGQSKYTEAYAGTIAGVSETPASTSHFCLRTLGENVGENAKIQVLGTGTDATLLFAETAEGDDNELDGATFKWSLDNSSREYQVIFTPDEDDGSLSLQQVIDKINAITPNVASESATTPPALTLTSNKVGEASQIEVLNGTSNIFLGFTNSQADLGSGRPNPDLAVNIAGEVVIQGHVLRDGLTSYPFPFSVVPIYMAYKGLRLDMSPDAQNPGLITWNDIATITEVAPPVSPDNPGSLMSYLAKLNAPRISVASIGVGEVSADAPDGTPLGYSKALEFLQSEEVYGLALASQNAVIHQNGLTHVGVMSEPENKGERILLFNPPMPTRANPTSVGSGTDANSTGTTNQITIDSNIAPALIALGIDPNLDINPLTGPIINEIYLDLGGDDKAYLVQRVDSGTQVTVRTSFASGDGNDDSFFSTTELSNSIVSDDWSIYKRGDPLTLPGSDKPDKQAIAETVQGAASAYLNRRGFYVFPDKCSINVTGLEQQVKAYYATAAIVGMVGQLPPQQGFTNYPITGLVKVTGSNDMFTETQLNIMAAGGVYILVQDSEGAPVISRHQLSTDLTSIEKRELSITKVVDYTAKFVRAGLRNFIGRSNITQAFLDQLSTVCQGLMNFLTENGVLNGAEINNIIQSEDQPDTVLIDITLDVPYPCNYIRVTLII